MCLFPTVSDTHVHVQLGDVEATRHTTQVFLALKQGHATLQKLQREVTIQDMERLLDDSAETKALQVLYIQLLLSRPVASSVASSATGSLHELQDEVNKALDMTLTSEEEEAAAEELSEMQALHPVDDLPNVPRVSSSLDWFAYLHVYNMSLTYSLA